MLNAKDGSGKAGDDQGRSQSPGKKGPARSTLVNPVLVTVGNPALPH